MIKKLPQLCSEDAKSVLPVYGIQNGKPVQDRSGVLLAIADQGFLLTASHGLRDITKAEIPLYVTSPRQSEGGIPLIGVVLGANEQLVDIAAIKMTSEVKAKLVDAGARFLRVTDVDNSASSIPGIYLVRGYPTACNADAMTFCTVLYDGDSPDEAEYPYDESVHLLLDHSSEIQDYEHQMIRSPKIFGLSGGGIWRLTEKHPSDLGSWSPEERKLVAIQTKCRHGDYLKGTWIKYAFRLIYEKCPELRQVMSCAYPS